MSVMSRDNYLKKQPKDHISFQTTSVVGNNEILLVLHFVFIVFFLLLLYYSNLNYEHFEIMGKLFQYMQCAYYSKRFVTFFGWANINAIVSEFSAS